MKKFMEVALVLAILLLTASVSSAQVQPPTGETIFISTFSGNQIVKVVDVGPPGTATVINTDIPETPEDIVVGPDGKIYICDADQNTIRRMNQDGTLVETVYSTNPAGPEGPSFNTLGDLYFNTRGPGHTGVWKITSAQLSGPLPVIPTNVLTAGQTGSSFGEGTVFDTQDNLLIVDRSGNRVLKSSPPYTTASALISTNLNIPIGIAVNSQNDIFVGNNGAGTISHFNSSGGFVNTYVTFTSPDTPVYMQFDASDNLFVATVQDADAGHGKLWRVPPSGSATLVVDLNTAFGTLLGRALGLGLPATTFTTPQLRITPGIPMTFTDGTIITQTLQLPNDVILNGAVFMAVSFMQIAPADFSKFRLPATGATTPNTWSGGTAVPAGTTLTPLNGTGGNGIVAEKLCFDANDVPLVHCDIIAPTTLIQLTSVYDTQAPQPIPALIIATDGANDWANITDFFTSDCCTIGGGTKGLNTDEAIVNLLSPYSASVQQPINPDGSSTFNARRGVIPVKFTLTQNNVATCALVPATIALTRIAVATAGAIDESTYLLAADNGSNFRITGCQYIYNLPSSSLAAGTYRVDIIINGVVVGSGFFAIK
jgi:hypothetical protein